MMKRIFDIVFSALALFVLGPVFLILAVLIRLDSSGPLFFKQERVGKDCVPFKMFKFRKFHHAPGPEGPGLSLRTDNRLTTLGKILEEYKLNELPQFLNVLRGDMSLVGPRPETPEFVLSYGDGFSQVLKVKQGIFGVNQLIFFRESQLFAEGENAESFYIEQILPRKVKNDIEYIRKANFLYDVAILGRCIWAVLRRPAERIAGIAR